MTVERENSGGRRLSPLTLSADDQGALKLAALLWFGSMALGAISTTLAQSVSSGEALTLLEAWKYLWMLSTLLLAFPLSFALYKMMLALASRHAVVRLLVIAPVVLVAAILQAVFDHQAGDFLADLVGAPPFRPLIGPAFILNTNSYLGLYALYVCLIELGTVRARAQRYAREAAEHALQGAEARELARKAQLELLWFQLNPHFLFNTLNNVISMVVADKPDRATVMLRRLSTYLRATLNLSGNALLSLESEMEAVEAYAEIEAVRFDGALALEVDYPMSLRRAAVPALILLPLVENAIKYAVAPSRGKAAITVRAWRSGDVLWIEVRDSGLAVDALSPPAGGTGLGLRNVEERLLAQYGAAAGVEAGPADGGFRVRLHLPLSLKAK